jgi:alkanesulfonate monooxygenase SsuD/methylene tetrahydromethanopterin reductase-like flavin-dependent oxidoreductase (luciferase family)
MTRFCVRVHHAGYTFAQLRDLAHSAERLGFDGLSLYDVLNPRALEVWTALSALGAVTSRLTLMPLVLDVGYRHPALVAKMAASLQALTDGRLILGLGYGGNPADHATYDFGWEPRVSRRVSELERQVRVIRALWQSDFVASAIQILIASRGKEFGLPGVARSADLANVSFDLSPSEWQAYQKVLTGHLLAAGRAPSDLGLTHNATVVIAARRADALDAFERLAASRNLTAEQARHGIDHAFVGTPDDIVARIRSYADAGVPLAWIFLLFPDLPGTDSLELFARNVLPAVR